MENKVYRKKQIREGIWQIEEYGVYCYLIIGSARAFLIDTGTGFGDLAAFIREITPLPLTVAATHAHPDHIGGRGAFPALYLPDRERGLARFYGTLAMRRLMFGKAAMEKYHTTRKAIKRGKFRTKYLPLHDGDRFDLGGRTVVSILVPGHTKGGMMFYAEQDHMLFTGDDLCRALWMFLPGATDVQTWAESTQRILPYLETSELWSAHDGEAQDPGLVKKLIDTGRRLVGSQKNTFLPRIRVYPKDYTDHGIIYRANRIRTKKRDER